MAFADVLVALGAAVAGGLAVALVFAGIAAIARADRPPRDDRQAPTPRRRAGVPEPPAELPPPAADGAPVCQVRWWWPTPRGSRFYAATVDEEGVEERIAWSPRFGWRWPLPPEETPGARRALDELVRTLTDAGWLPLNGVGREFDDDQWYALRFKASAPSGSPPGAPSPRTQR